jgi:hypothetical protein
VAPSQHPGPQRFLTEPGGMPSLPARSDQKWPPANLRGHQPDQTPGEGFLRRLVGEVLLLRGSAASPPNSRGRCPSSRRAHARFGAGSSAFRARGHTICGPADPVDTRLPRAAWTGWAVRWKEDRDAPLSAFLAVARGLTSWLRVISHDRRAKSSLLYCLIAVAASASAMELVGIVTNTFRRAVARALR